MSCDMHECIWDERYGWMIKNDEAFLVLHTHVSTLEPVRQAQWEYGHADACSGCPSSSHGYVPERLPRALAGVREALGRARPLIPRRNVPTTALPR